ncbi:hypothetical protein BpHYR1_020915 [Brachionus plicatilis]|uniref:Uncharacterized protein n=1 Tax=Brachionus plicatilis TaxID=10195 RepID=A0A3M7REN9_BRAPC|nr:hypothetical protein BpHYR1_020915 [Brachionus plicatilis]
MHWHETFSNADPYTRTNSELLNCDDLGIAFQWTSQGRCRAGRSGATWRSTISKELSEIGMT